MPAQAHGKSEGSLLYHHASFVHGTWYLAEHQGGAHKKEGLVHTGRNIASHDMHVPLAAPPPPCKCLRVVPCDRRESLLENLLGSAFIDTGLYVLVCHIGVQYGGADAESRTALS